MTQTQSCDRPLTGFCFNVSRNELKLFSPAAAAPPPEQEEKTDFLQCSVSDSTDLASGFSGDIESLTLSHGVGVRVSAANSRDLHHSHSYQQ